ncbi:SgrR [Klebsiella pneumoniae]|uniref:SgrR n=1 Tax=Klebsiella pneumoniae TaxID=573 RepID=A0A378FY99_KLEPN|nr:SgrR [Klebsiella pneumoniae]
MPWVRNNQNQLKIHAFEDYFGYRALIDEVNVWVLPEISEEPNGGLTLQGNTESEKAVESRLEEGCYYLLFDSRSPLGANDRCALAKLSVSARQPALPCGRTLPGQLVSRLRPAARAGITPATTPARSRRGWRQSPLPTTRDHVEHRVIGGIMRDLLAAHQVKLEIQELEYDAWHRGEVVSAYLAQQRELHLTDRNFRSSPICTKSR